MDKALLMLMLGVEMLKLSAGSGGERMISYYFYQVCQASDNVTLLRAAIFALLRRFNKVAASFGD